MVSNLCTGGKHGGSVSFRLGVRLRFKREKVEDLEVEALHLGGCEGQESRVEDFRFRV
jgi:hypothetical protein